MKISLRAGDWTKLRQILQRIVVSKLLVPDIKKGINQAAAGAGKDELWSDANDNNTIKLGV